jgi:uncharacterized phiE125 gp8 family phage protein
MADPAELPGHPMTAYLLAGPAAEPISLAEAKAHCRVDDDAEDGLMATLIAAARIHVEAASGRALIAQSWRLVLDAWPRDGVVRLPVGPATALTAVTAYDADDTPHELATGQFRLDGAGVPALLLAPPAVEGMPALRSRRGIEIDFVAGYGEAGTDVPEDLRQAVRVLVGYWFENRDVAVAPNGADGPAGLARLLTPYRRVAL